MAFKADPTWLRKTISGSSQIKQVLYDNNENRLYIIFNTGATYSYESVSAEEHRSLIGSSSPGKYFHSNIKQKSTTKQSNG
tara:strand:+ start:267 stop:509 length:243 start_codon:yes stop_codon:yes gene_type:complete